MMNFFMCGGQFLIFISLLISTLGLYDEYSVLFPCTSDTHRVWCAARCRSTKASWRSWRIDSTSCCGKTWSWKSCVSTWTRSATVGRGAGRGRRETAAATPAPPRTPRSRGYPPVMTGRSPRLVTGTRDTVSRP